MQIGEGSAGQFDLTAGLERHRLAVEGKPDDVAALEHRLPAEALQSLQHGADAGRAVIGQRPQVAEPVSEFFVLGADAPCVGGLAASLNVLDEGALRFDRGRPVCGVWRGHGFRRTGGTAPKARAKPKILKDAQK